MSVHVNDQSYNYGSHFHILRIRRPDYDVNSYDIQELVDNVWLDYQYGLPTDTLTAALVRNKFYLVYKQTVYIRERSPDWIQFRVHCLPCAHIIKEDMTA